MVVSGVNRSSVDLTDLPWSVVDPLGREEEDMTVGDPVWLDARPGRLSLPHLWDMRS